MHVDKFGEYKVSKDEGLEEGKNAVEK